MINSIYSIPIQEVFEKKDGCPICGIRNMLEERCLEYIMGSSMMESSVRFETNKHGFCFDHLGMMVSRQNKLALALMLETHFEEIETKNIVSQIRNKKSPPSYVDSCFICNEVSEAMIKMLGNVIELYTNDANFRYLFRNQKFFCYPHYDAICVMASATMNKKTLELFMDEITELTRAYLLELKNDVHAFASLSDYRTSRAEPEENVLTALERATYFLTSRKIK